MSKTLQMPKFKYDREYVKLVPAMSKEERNKLRESLVKDGFWSTHPVICNSKMVLLAGMNRAKICEEENIIPEFKIRDFPNKLEEKKFVIQDNLARRNLNDFQKA